MEAQVLRTSIGSIVKTNYFLWSHCIVEGSWDSRKRATFESVFRWVLWAPLQSNQQSPAKKHAIRLNAGQSWNSRLYGHGNILNNVVIIPEFVVYKVPILVFSTSFIYLINGQTETLPGSSAILYRFYIGGSTQKHRGRLVFNFSSSFIQ